jgi:CRP/FNR family transcriptional regulator, cyclic AMP receptor protein
MRLSLQFPHLARAELFEDISSSTVSTFLDDCQLHTVPNSTVILQQHADVTGMILIAHGCVEVSLTNADNHLAIIHHAREGETLGEIEAISRQPALACCTALGPVTYLFCHLSRLADHLADPLMQRNVMRITRGRLLRDNQRKYMDQNFPLDRRVCAYLLRLSDRSHSVTQSQGYIAKLANCSRQSINRALAGLRAQGLIAVEKGKIRLVDRAGIERKLSGE